MRDILTLNNDIKQIIFDLVQEGYGDTQVRKKLSQLIETSSMLDNAIKSNVVDNFINDNIVLIGEGNRDKIYHTLMSFLTNINKAKQGLNKGHYKKNIREEDIVKYYTVYQWSANKIAKKLGCTQPTVVARLKRLGLIE